MWKAFLLSKTNKYTAIRKERGIPLKKKLVSVTLASALIALAGCSQEEVVSSSQPPSIYVERDDLEYEKTEAEDIESTSAQSPDNTSSPVYSTTSDKPSQPADIGGTGGNSNKPSPSNNGGDNSNPSGNEDDQSLPEGIYETTIPETLTTNASFGDIKVLNMTYDTEENVYMYGGIATEIRLGANNYGSWRYVLFDDKEFLPIRGEEYRKTVLIDNSETDGLSFAFNGAAHTFKGKEDVQANVFLEIEEASGVASAKRAAAISTAEAFVSSVKGISTVLGEFNSVDTNGHAVYYPPTDVEYKVVSSTGEYSLRVGYPYQELVDAIGEGNKIADDNGTYYAYKSDDYTLVVEKTEYPDIKPSQEMIELGVPENTVLISSIYLIKNQVELPPQRSEE